MVDSIPDDQMARAVEKIKTRGGHLTRTPPVILKETKSYLVHLISAFIPRSKGTDDLIFRIVVYRKGEPPSGYLQVERESPWLTEDSARILIQYLKEHLAIAESSGEGTHIVLKIREGSSPEVDVEDPQRIANALAGVLKQKDILDHFLTSDLGEGLTKAIRGSIRIQELKGALATLRTYLDEGVVEEQEYQEWCNKHHWAFGNTYVLMDEVRRIAAGDTVDLLLKSALDGFRDIIELKRPDMEVLGYDDQRRCFYFMADASKAIGQCHRYLDVLQETAAQGLRDHPEIVAYHPRAVIVIGRSNNWEFEKLKALHGLNARLHGISVMTYNQLLLMGERLLSSLGEVLPHDEDIPG